MATILILEPDESLSASLSEAIEQVGLRTIVQENAADVADLLSVEPPALIVLDLAIEDGRGVELCHQIRDTSGGELLPILMLGTGEEGVESFGDALAEGGDYYFDKPLDHKKLISKILTYVGVDRDAPTVVAKPPEPESKDLAGRVEQMMNLGESFGAGLLEPSGDDGEAAPEAGELTQPGGPPPDGGQTQRSELLAQELFDDEDVEEPPAEAPLLESNRAEATSPGGLLPPEDGAPEQPAADDEAASGLGFPDQLEPIAADDAFLKAPDSEPPPLDESDDEPVAVADEDLRDYEDRLMAEAAAEVAAQPLSAAEQELAALEAGLQAPKKPADTLEVPTQPADTLEMPAKPADTQEVPTEAIEEALSRADPEADDADAEDAEQLERWEQERREQLAASEARSRRQAERERQAEAEWERLWEIERRKQVAEAEERRQEAAEQERRAQEEQERLWEAERQQQLAEAERRRQEAAEQERRAQEEQARLWEEERQQQLAEAERKARAIAEARKREALKKRKEEEERKRKEEEARKRKEEEERKRKEEEERKRKEEEERKRKEDEARKRKEAEERKRKEAEERKRKEEEERRAQEEQERLWEAERQQQLQAAERRRQEAAAREAEAEAEQARRWEEERKRQLAEAERKAIARAEAEARQREEEEQRRRDEAETTAAPGGDDEDEALAADDLWADSWEEDEVEGADAEQMAQAATSWMEDQDAADGPSTGAFDLPPGTDPDAQAPSTDHAGKSLVALLEEEARLARELAEEAPDLDPDEGDLIGTIPDLPPHPDGEPTSTRAGGDGSIRSRLRQADEFDRVETEDLPRVEQLAEDEPESSAGQADAEQAPDAERAPRRVPLKRPGLRVVRAGRERDAAGRPEADADATGQDAAEGEGEDFFGAGDEPAVMPPDPESTDLATESVPAVLWRLHVQRVSGTVTFRSGGDHKQVFFARGIPVGVRSSQTADRLEEILYHQGLIDREAYAEARVKGIDRSRALAAHLVERGLLRPEELFPTVRRHLEDCLLGLFEWRSGRVHYEPVLAPDAEMVRLAMPVGALVVEGIRRKFLLPRMMEEMGGPASLLAPIPAEDRRPEAPELRSLGLSQRETEILRLVDGLRPIEEIVFLSGHDVSTVYQVLLAAVVLGLARVAVRGLHSADSDPEQARQRDVEIRRRRLEAKFEQIHHASYFDILGVTSKASPYEIKTAFERLAREFHELHYSHPALADLATKLDVVQRTLVEARDVLSDELLREGYRSALSQDLPPTADGQS